MTSMIRNRLISRLHILKKEQGLDDDLYRDKLEAVTGKRSAADLDDAELETAVRRFAGAGQRLSTERLPASPQARLIQAMWLSLYNLGAVADPTDAAITAFIKHQTGIDAARWLKRPEDTKAVVEPLKDWLTREGVEWGSERHDPPYTKLAAYKVAVAQMRKLVELGAYQAGSTWTGNARRAPELVMNYAKAIRDIPGTPDQWSNPQWGRVTKALGKKLRAAMKAKKEQAATGWRRCDERS